MNTIKKIYMALALASFTISSAHAEEISLKLSSGLEAMGSLELAEEAKLSGSEIILLVHGTLAHKDMDFIQTQRELLNERGLNVLAVNLTLGLNKRLGMYDCQMTHMHKHRDAMAEITDWLNWLGDQKVASVTLMGHSRGGNQVVWTAFEKPHPLVKKVIAVAPMTWVAQRETVTYQKENGDGLLQVLNAAMAKEEVGRQADILDNIDFLYCPKTTVQAATFLDYYAAEQKFNTPDLVQELDLPTLVIAGDNDRVVQDLPYQMSKVVKANIQFETVQDADHMFLDFAGEDLADLVEGFVSQ